MPTQELKRIILKDWPSRLVLTCLVAFAGIAWSQGKQILNAKVIEAVQPSLDTLAKKQEATDKKVELVQEEVGKLNDNMKALISILIESSPQIKKAAQSRLNKNKDSQDVQNALQGDKK